MTYMPDIPDQDRDALASYDRLAEAGADERDSAPEIPLLELEGETVRSVEFNNAMGYAVLTFTNGTTLYVDNPTAYRGRQ